MAITQIETEYVGQIGDLPRFVKMVSTDPLDIITQPNYLYTSINAGNIILPTDFIFMNYKPNKTDIFLPIFSLKTITLQLYMPNGTPATLPITIVASGNQIMEPNNAYLANGGALVTLQLPPFSEIGDVLEINGKGPGGWQITQGASQLIHIGNLQTSVGVLGGLVFENQYDSLRLKCITANTEWAAIGGPQGTFTLN